MSNHIAKIRNKNNRADRHKRNGIVEAIIEVSTWEFRYRVRMAWRILRGARKKAKR